MGISYFRKSSENTQSVWFNARTMGFPRGRECQPPSWKTRPSHIPCRRGDGGPGWALLWVHGAELQKRKGKEAGWRVGRQQSQGHLVEWGLYADWVCVCGGELSHFTTIKSIKHVRWNLQDANAHTRQVRNIPQWPLNYEWAYRPILELIA